VTDQSKERWRIGLYVLGACLLASTVYGVGARKILAVAARGLPFLPLIALCSLTFYSLESWAHRSMLGSERSKIPNATFVRTTLAAYAGSVLLPLGRASAEVLRTAAYSPYVGGARAVAASATFQAPTLLSTAVHGFACYLVLGSTFGFSQAMSWILLAHATGSCILAGLVFAVARRAALGKRVARWFPKLARHAETFDGATTLPIRVFLRATGYCLLARVAEVVQYAVILAALGLTPSPAMSVVAGAIHLVGATVGEATPSQLGAVEGAFAYFAEALGLGGDPARAVTIPLLVRAAQVALAAGALVFSWSPSRPTVPVSEEPG
jgi:hypothetical protein